MFFRIPDIAHQRVSGEVTRCSCLPLGSTYVWDLSNHGLLVRKLDVLFLRAVLQYSSNLGWSSCEKKNYWTHPELNRTPLAC